MLHITGLYASILAFIIIGLGYRVVRLRVKYRVGLKDGGHPELIQAIRIHGNATEWVPITLILFACAESQQLMPWVLHTLGVILVLARSYHIYGISHSTGRSRGRVLGMAGTWSVAITLAACNIFYFANAFVKV
ncbi:MAG: MAPEG family protein [Candidatus Berkiella sp.]